MSKITVTVSRLIQAPAAVVYNILADYDHHRNILPPKFFMGLDIIEGGIGAGTKFVLHAKSLSGQTEMHMAVTEPEPGAVLVERNIHTGLVTSFIVKPVNENTSNITFETVWEPESGFAGFVDRYTTPFLMRMVYKQEQNILNDYAQKQVNQSGALI